jgi:hypothetical protein
MCFEALPVYTCGCPHPCGIVQILTSDSPNCTSTLTPTCRAWFPLSDMTVPTTYTYTWDSCLECQKAIDEGKERTNPNKLGCFSCRVRRIECGMEQPYCLRCTIRGRKCAGYTLFPQVLPPPLPFQPQRMRLPFGGGRVASAGPLKNSVTDEGGSVHLLEGYGRGNISWRDYVLEDTGLEELENEIRGLEIGKQLGG